jgi:large subunit ribosomal protein L35
MPKMKTKSGAKKRFRKTGTGKFKRFKCGKSHILTKKSTKRKRRLRKMVTADPTNVRAMNKLMPYA